eukprot:GHVL01023565.1.p1 GENE.GHVL01023565.1~~GHVL01023565.1.p1  ORF type:complete len:316 (+),score=50.16 GHVL01023565.1:36-983(+)
MSVKLFVGSVPASTSEESLKEELLKYGRIESLFFCPDTKGTNRGWAFANVPTNEDALAVIAGLDQNLVLPGSDKPIEVRYADQKAQMNSGGLKSPWVPYTTADGNRYYYNIVTCTASWDRPAELDPGNVGSAFGPAGCNVYIFHLPHEWSETELIQYFSAFGKIVGVRVPRDEGSNRNKGYAFVSYDGNKAALNAVVGLNGLNVGGKWLKVMLKKGEENFYPAGFPQGNHRAIVDQQRQYLQSIGLLDIGAQHAGDSIRHQFGGTYIPDSNNVRPPPVPPFAAPPVATYAPPMMQQYNPWGPAAPQQYAYRYQPY